MAQYTQLDPDPTTKGKGNEDDSPNPIIGDKSKTQIYGEDSEPNSPEDGPETVEAEKEPDDITEDRSIDFGQSLQHQNFLRQHGRNFASHASDNFAEEQHNQLKEPSVIQPDTKDTIFDRARR